MAKIKLPKWLDEIWGKCNRGETVFRRFRKTIVVEANPSPSYTRTSKQDRVRRAYRYALDDYRKLSPEQREVYKLKGYRFNLPAYQMYMKERIPFYLKVLDYYKIIIDNSNNSNDLTDYQILLSVNNDSEFFSTIENKTCIEVYDEDGKTLLPFWVEEWDSINYNARIWIKVPLIKANSVKSLFLIANKDRSECLSDPYATFVKVIPGLFLSYPIDEGSGNTLYDRSGNGYNGTIYGAEWQKIDDEWMLYFDGVDDYVEVPYSQSTDTLGSKTIVTLVKTDPSRLSYVNDIIAFSFRILIMQYRSYGLQVIWTYVDGTRVYTNNLNIFSGDEWLNLALVYDEEEQRLKYYANEQLYIDYGLSQKIKGTVDKIRIAYPDSGTDHQFGGYIGFVRMYERVLDISEIKALCEHYAFESNALPYHTLVRKRSKPEPLVSYSKIK